jgi:hypothetical protein
MFGNISNGIVPYSLSCCIFCQKTSIGSRKPTASWTTTTTTATATTAAAATMIPKGN